MIFSSVLLLVRTVIRTCASLVPRPSWFSAYNIESWEWPGDGAKHVLHPVAVGSCQI